MDLLTMHFVVDRIDGDYAHLCRVDSESDGEKLVAMALLPPDIMEGSKLKYEMFQYEVIE